MTVNEGILSCIAALLVFSLGASAQQHSVELVALGGGSWQVIEGNPPVAWQNSPEGASSAVPAMPASQGGVWRCLVEPGVLANRCGIWFAASPTLDSGFLLTLGETPGVGGLVLRNAAGEVLWQDKFAPWTFYTPYWLEGVVEPGRVRVQLLHWNGQTLLAQSDWLEAPGADPAAAGALAFFTESTVARFYRWARVDTPLSPIVPDSPTRMRLVSDDRSEWVIVGAGDWRWTSPERAAIRQGAGVERSTAVNTALGGAEGVWRSRVSVEPGAGGAGMIIQTDTALNTGFNVWLGGRHGAGGLMLYRVPLTSLWSSEQEKWFYDTEYILEGAIRDGKVSARLLSADGSTVIAESPAFDLAEEEKGRAGHIAFMTWKGKARFWDFSEDTRADGAVAPQPAESATDLGPGWQVREGNWQWSDAPGGPLEQTGAEGSATALNLEAKGARAVYRVSVTPGPSTQAVGLLFQVSADLTQGFELVARREGLVLRTLEGRALYENRDFALPSDGAVVLEGIVVTDRVQVRALDSDGAEMLRSDYFYVSDRNNTREGVMGFRTENGPARFSDWSVTSSE